MHKRLFKDILPVYEQESKPRYKPSTINPDFEDLSNAKSPQAADYVNDPLREEELVLKLLQQGKVFDDNLNSGLK